LTSERGTKNKGLAYLGLTHTIFVGLALADREEVFMRTALTTDLFNVYVAKTDLAESSVAIKRQALKLFVKQFGNLPADEITDEMAADYKLALPTGRRGRSSANIYLDNLIPFFNWLAVNDYVRRNPFRQIRRYRTEQKIRLAYTREEIGRILTVADCRWRILIRLAAQYSLRRGECLNIVRSDIEGDWLHIQSKRQSRDTWPWKIKNYRQALWPLGPELRGDIEILLRTEVPIAQPYILVVPKMFRKMLHLQAENSLTYNLRGCPMNNFDRTFQRLLQRACVPSRRFQDLRSLFCNVLRKRMPFDEVSTMMRHRNLQTTRDFYAKYNYAELATQARRIISDFYKST